MFDEFFSRHEKVGLCFSAGKDSAACLWMLESYWPRIEVIWVNPGDPHWETVGYMEGIAALVPRFTEVQGKQPEYIRLNGKPAFGDIRCCAANMWLPIQNYVREAGITGLIRGQKDSDHLKSPVSSGDVVGGVEFLHPVETWTDSEVIEYLGDKIPPSYKRGLKTSLDCQNCVVYG
jgi:3'-phosphoadenosine 5'-phosphosulfate sulfotransferase (PAPS reductase)/FAD synthetase